MFAVFLTLAAGCAPLVIKPERPAPSLYPQDLYVGVSVEYGYAYADKMAVKYYERLSADLGGVSKLGRFQIVNAAVVLGLAAFGAHTDAITGAALVGGTTYALGTWDSSNDRRAIYVKGIQALVCAQRAIAPLDLGRDSRDALKQDRDVLDAAATELAAAMSAVEAASLRDPGNAAIADTRKRQALQDLAAALTERRRAIQLTTTANRAGQELSLQVDAINVAVNQALAGTAAGLDSVPAIISQLSAFSQIFAPEVDLNALRAGRFEAGDDVEAQAIFGNKSVNSPMVLADALGLLERRRVEVMTAAERVKAHVEEVDRARVATDLAACNVKAEALPVGFNVSTTRIQFTQSANGFTNRHTGRITTTECCSGE